MIDWSMIKIDEKFRGVVEELIEERYCGVSSVMCVDCPFYRVGDCLNNIEYWREYLRRLDALKVDTVQISLRQLSYICNSYVLLCKMEDSLAEERLEVSKSLDIEFDESDEEYMKRRKADLVKSFFNRLKELNGG